MTMDKKKRGKKTNPNSHTPFLCMLRDTLWTIRFQKLEGKLYARVQVCYGGHGRSWNLFQKLVKF